MKEQVFYSEYFYEKGSKDASVLQKNAVDYPFSSIASFLLLYHYKKNGHPGFEKLAKKTAVLFNNQHWLQFQLLAPFNVDLLAETVQEDNLHNEEDNHGAKSDIELVVTEKSIQNKPEEKQEATSQEEDENSFNDEASGHQEEITNENVVEVLAEELPLNEEKDEVKDERAQEANEAIQTATYTVKMPEVNNDVSETEPLAFEPLHTVDYFASLGIKITDELVANDKLGSQMKSFTEWLKSMKKVHPSKLGAGDETTDKLIQGAAEASNIKTEVLTEAMAEVLIKQGKKEKAIEMFTKLSLINPAKSAYFAGKIENIKSN